MMKRPKVLPNERSQARRAIKSIVADIPIWIISSNWNDHWPHEEGTRPAPSAGLLPQRLRNPTAYAGLAKKSCDSVPRRNLLSR